MISVENRAENILKRRPRSKTGEWVLRQELKEMVRSLSCELDFYKKAYVELEELRAAHAKAIGWIAVLLEEKKDK